MLAGCITIDEGIKSSTNGELLETKRKFSAAYDVFGELRDFEYYKSGILVRKFIIHIHFYEKVKSNSTNQDFAHHKYFNLSWDLFLLDQMAREFGPGENYEDLGGPPAREDSINDYIKWCKDEGVSPEKPYSGKFNLRISPELHRKIALAANQQKLSLNKFVEKALIDELVNL